MQDNSVRVIRVEAIADATIQKTEKRFSIPVRYVLEDGRTVEYRITRQRRRDVVAEIEALPKPPDDDLRVRVENGRVVQTERRFSLF